MDDLDILTRTLENLSDRVTGPMKFRVLLQPIMASVFAIRAGLRDARTGKPPYFWALVTDPAHRIDMLKDGWKDIGKVFLLALALDVAYQIIVLRFVYPGEAIIVALILAIVPYLILRALTNRLVRKKGHRQYPTSPSR